MIFFSSSYSNRSIEAIPEEEEEEEEEEVDKLDDRAEVSSSYNDPGIVYLVFCSKHTESILSQV